MPLTATVIQNDGSVVGTQVIESTVSGDNFSAVLLKNDGTLTLGNPTHPGSISSDNGLFKTDGSGNVTAHNETLNGALTVSGASTLSSLLIGTRNIFRFTSGFANLSSNLNTITHSFGAIPSCIMVTDASSSGFNGSFRISNITSTTFGITTSNLSTSVNWIALG